MRHAWGAATTGLLLILADSGLARAEFRVNEGPSHTAPRPAVAADSQGNVLVVWGDETGPPGVGSVLGRRFDPAGAPAGSMVIAAVSAPSGNPPARPDVATNASGEAVVVWAQLDGAGYGIWARRYDAAGTPLGSALPVNTATAGSQYPPAVGIDATGSFVIVWRSYVPTPADDSVQARRFDAAGAPLGPEFRVNAMPVSGEAEEPDIAVAPDGTFVVAGDRVDAGLGQSVSVARRFDAAGAPIAGEIDLGTSTYEPEVAVEPAGGFIAVFSVSGGVSLRRFDADRLPRGPAAAVNDAPGLHQWPTVAVQPTGEFVVVWAEELLDAQGTVGKLGRILGRLFHADGTPASPQFVLNAVTPARRVTPSLTTLPADGYFAAWINLRGDLGDVAAFFWRAVQPVRKTKISIRDNADATKRKV